MGQRLQIESRGISNRGRYYRLVENNLFSITQLEFIYFIQLISKQQIVARNFKSLNEILLKFQNVMNIETIGFFYLEFVLDLP